MPSEGRMDRGTTRTRKAAEETAAAWSWRWFSSLSASVQKCISDASVEGEPAQCGNLEHFNVPMLEENPRPENLPGCGFIDVGSKIDFFNPKPRIKFMLLVWSTCYFLKASEGFGSWK